MQEADARTQEADTQTDEADTGGRHRRQTRGTDRDPPLVACIAHLKEGAGLTSILKTQCPRVFHT